MIEVEDTQRGRFQRAIVSNEETDRRCRSAQNNNFRYK